MTNQGHVVCDGCGYFYGLIPTHPAPECPVCGADIGAWAFPEKRAALEFAAQVKERLRA